MASAMHHVPISPPNINDSGFIEESGLHQGRGRSGIGLLVFGAMTRQENFALPVAMMSQLASYCRPFFFVNAMAPHVRAATKHNQVQSCTVQGAKTIGKRDGGIPPWWTF